MAKYLKEQNPDVQVIGVDPYGSVYYTYFHTGVFDKAEIYPYLTEGVGEDILAGNMDFEIVDDYVRVDDQTSMRMTRRLAREEGLFIGQSCGMAMAGALDWLQAHRDGLAETDVVVVLLPDSGFRYLSKTYNDTWMRDHGFLERRPDVTVEHVLGARRQKARVLAAAPEDTLGQAIQGMAEHGISQMPVIENGEVIGSLTETVILNRLIAQPDAREQAVREVMGRAAPHRPARAPPRAPLGLPRRGHRRRPRRARGPRRRRRCLRDHHQERPHQRPRRGRTAGKRAGGVREDGGVGSVGSMGGVGSLGRGGARGRSALPANSQELTANS